MSDGGEETVCIGREIDAFDAGFQVEHCADEGGVLMTESVMFLTCPGTGFDIVERSHVFSPGTFVTDFDKLGVLNHHRMHDSQERFIRRENPRTSGQSIT